MHHCTLVYDAVIRVNYGYLNAFEKYRQRHALHRHTYSEQIHFFPRCRAFSRFHSCFLFSFFCVFYFLVPTYFSLGSISFSSIAFQLLSSPNIIKCVLNDAAVLLNDWPTKINSMGCHCHPIRSPLVFERALIFIWIFCSFVSSKCTIWDFIFSCFRHFVHALLSKIMGGSKGIK